jgi:hypothetical protein
MIGRLLVLVCVAIMADPAWCAPESPAGESLKEAGIAAFKSAQYPEAEKQLIKYFSSHPETPKKMEKEVEKLISDLRKDAGNNRAQIEKLKKGLDGCIGLAYNKQLRERMKGPETHHAEVHNTRKHVERDSAVPTKIKNQIHEHKKQSRGATSDHPDKESAPAKKSN